VASAAHFAACGSAGPQDGPDKYQQDADGPQDGDARQHAEDEEDDPEDDHVITLSLVKGRTRVPGVVDGLRRFADLVIGLT
jgi:hypothetical protein